MNPSPSSIRAPALCSTALSPATSSFRPLGATHPCAVNNDGDPIAQYDKVNNRWILTQFSVTNGGSLGFWQCIAISKTSDATGAYNVYAYKQPNFNDYPKFGVWNGTYYATYNIFSGNSFAGARLCAYDGASMRAGAPAARTVLPALQLLWRSSPRGRRWSDRASDRLQ